MPKRIGLRTLTTEEEAEIRRIANSRKEPMRLVQRARVINSCYAVSDWRESSDCKLRNA